MRACLALLALLFWTTAAEARPFNYKLKTPSVAVEFSYSAEAAAIPALVRRFSAELAKERAETIRGGKEDYAQRRIGWESVTKITTSGQTPRLLSLSRIGWEFTGGAHGNGGTTGILWDRRLGKEVSFPALFRSPSAFVAALRPAYCKALDAERKKRRGADYEKSPVSEFDACPKFPELALIPSASAAKGRFNQIHLIASPYLAGPYAEGEYDISLPVSAKLIALMKPEYRSSFEAQRQ